VSGKAHNLRMDGTATGALLLHEVRHSALCSAQTPHWELAGVLRRRAKAILTRTTDAAAIVSPSRRAGRSGGLYDGPPE
jgi:hypothetical protein